VTDLDRQLRESLNSVGQNYHPKDATAARARFLARRRRRALGLYAGAALATGTVAVVAFAVFGPNELVPDIDDAPSVPVVGPSVEARIAARLPVGDAPSGVGSGGGLLWVANSGDDTVAAVDARTNKVVRVFPVAGGPDDVLVNDGFAWVATASGDVTAIDIETGRRRAFPNTFAPDSHLDLASAGGGGLWVAEGGGRLWRLQTGAKDEAIEYPLLFGDLSDVASSGDDVWVYDRSRGQVVHLETGGRAVVDRVSVGSSVSADLKVTQDFTWALLGEGGMLLQINNDSGDIVSRHELGGTFGALAEEGGVLYAMVTDGGPNGSGDGRLYRLDAASGAIMGDPVPLTNFPYDVEAGPDGIWVTNNSGDTLTRIELVTRDGAPADDNPVVATETLFYFSRAGDIFSYQWDGTTTPVVDSPAYESDPTVAPDGRSFLYARKQDVDSDSTISRYPGNDVVFEGEAGTSPEYGPDGRIAWVRFSETPPPITIVVDDPAQPGQRLEFEPDPKRGPSPLLPDQIAWDVSGDTIYFIDVYAPSPVLYSADVSVDTTEPSTIVIAPDEKRALYVSPAVLDDGTLWVVKLCCAGSGGYTVAELGPLVDGRFEKIVGLDDIVGQASLENIWFEPAGYLDYETETGWTIGDHRSWLVGQGEGLWLVNDTGEINVVDLTNVDDVTVVPVAQD
jgi:YVTN family beta-propeller protein